MVAQFQKPRARAAKAAPPRRPTVADIQRAVTGYYGLPPLAMVSVRRTRRFAHPRQLAMWLSRQLTTHSYSGIGERFYRHTTTVVDACSLVPDRLEADAELRADCAAVLCRVDQIRRANVLSLPLRRGGGPVGENLDDLAAEVLRNPADALSDLLRRMVDGPEIARR